LRAEYSIRRAPRSKCSVAVWAVDLSVDVLESAKSTARYRRRFWPALVRNQDATAESR